MNEQGEFLPLIELVLVFGAALAVGIREIIVTRRAIARDREAALRSRSDGEKAPGHRANREKRHE